MIISDFVRSITPPLGGRRRSSKYLDREAFGGYNSSFVVNTKQTLNTTTHAYTIPQVLVFVLVPVTFGIMLNISKFNNFDERKVETNYHVSKDK